MNIEEAINILELKTSAPTVDDIKSAFRTLAKRYHPDITGNIDSSNFIRVEFAYRFLMKYLTEIGYFSVSEREDVETFHSKIFIDEFIAIITQLHNDYIVLPRAINELVKANQFFNILENLFTEKVIESIRIINNVQKKKELIYLLSTVTAGHTLKFRKSFFNKILPIANGNKILEKMIKGTIYGIASQIFDVFTDNSINYNSEGKQEKEDNNKNQKFVYSSEMVDDFLKSFSEHQNRTISKEEYYYRPEKTLRESMKEEKDKEAGRLLFKKLKNHIKLNRIDVKINFKEIESLCQLLGIISNLGKYITGIFIKELTNDMGFETVMYRLVAEEKLSSKDFRILLEFFRHYLPNRSMFPDLINPSLKFNDYASIFNEMYFIYQIALKSNNRFSFG